MPVQLQTCAERDLNQDPIARNIERTLAEILGKISVDYALVDMRSIRRRFHQKDPDLYGVLSPLELEFLESCSMPKKKIQWISGRTAVKKALSKYLEAQSVLPDLCCIDLLNGDNSAPYMAQLPNIRVSITHSWPYCIGVLSDIRIGIDLEKKIMPRNSLLEHYFNPHEIQELSALDDMGRYSIQATIYWTRKEAVSKLLGLGMKMSFRDLDTVSDSLVLNCYNNKAVQLSSFSIGDYALSLAIERS